MASLPKKLRQRAESQQEYGGTARRLRETLVAWYRGRRLDDDAFARVFFGRAASESVSVKLREAALATAAGDIRGAAANVAEVIQHLGLDNWPRFLADAQIRAQAPGTLAEVAQSQARPNLKKDAIQPVYPLETAIGVAAGGIAGGIAGAARAAGAAIVKQFTPVAPPNTTIEVPSSPKTEENAQNRADYQRYTDELRQKMGKPAVTDPKLRHYMGEMYKDGAAVGSGSTADAIRAERATGLPVGQRWHAKKGADAVVFLRRWLESNPTASPGDRAAAENVLRDLINALAGK